MGKRERAQNSSSYYSASSPSKPRAQIVDQKLHVFVGKITFSSTSKKYRANTKKSNKRVKVLCKYARQRHSTFVVSSQDKVRKVGLNEGEADERVSEV